MSGHGEGGIDYQLQAKDLTQRMNAQRANFLHEYIPEIPEEEIFAYLNATDSAELEYIRQEYPLVFSHFLARLSFNIAVDEYHEAMGRGSDPDAENCHEAIEQPRGPLRKAFHELNERNPHTTLAFSDDEIASIRARGLWHEKFTGAPFVPQFQVLAYHALAALYTENGLEMPPHFRFRLPREWREEHSGLDEYTNALSGIFEEALKAARKEILMEEGVHEKLAGRNADTFIDTLKRDAELERRSEEVKSELLRLADDLSRCVDVVIGDPPTPQR